MANDDQWYKWRPWRGGYHVDQRVTSYGQSGGITAHTVNQFNVAQPKRDLHGPGGDGLRNELLSKAPRDKLINLLAVAGDPEAHDLVMQIREFLLGNGFQVGGPDYLMAVPPPRGINLNPDTWEITVGHRE